MNKRCLEFWSVCLTALMLGGANLSFAQDAVSGGRDWGRSVVTIEFTHKVYDYYQPWSKRPRTAAKNALVIGPRELLTTAEELNDLTLVRVQKDGRGKWWNAELSWIDYHANLAIITCADDTFWRGLEQAEFTNGKPVKENLQLVRWKNGNLEARKAEFTQYLVEDGRLTYINYLQMELSTDMSGVGGAEPVVAGGKVVGIANFQAGNICRVLPAVFVRTILEARKGGKYRGLGYFPFVWQPAENPAVHKFLKMDGEPRGAVVIDVPPGGPAENLKMRDIILQVDGFDIDIQGYYQDPDYGQLILENLATRGHFAGDTVRLKVWRDGKMQDIHYKLPRADYSQKLLPDYTFDRDPEYLIAGGLVFQPLTLSYLRSWGADWKRQAPFRLSYYNSENPTPERPALLVLSVVLPDQYNIGYQDVRFLVVDQVNGKKVSRLKDLAEALKKPVNGFHVIDFMRSDSLHRVVLDAAELDNATQRVLEQFRIQKDHVFNEDTVAGIGR